LVSIANLRAKFCLQVAFACWRQEGAIIAADQDAQSLVLPEGATAGRSRPNHDEDVDAFP
jgi:hypothetical protein